MISSINRVVSVAVLATLFASLNSYAALSLDPGRFSTAEIDALARKQGFKDASFPFYSSVNGCGPDGWKNELIPERSHIWIGAKFSAACDQHDRDYMTIGKNRAAADREFRSRLNRAVDGYLAQTVKQSIVRVVPKTIVQRVPRRVLKKVRSRIKDITRPHRWKYVVRDVFVTVIEYNKVTINETIKDFKAVTRASMLSPGRIAEMKLAVQVYYQAVRNVGGGFYKVSQEKQRSYEAWVKRMTHIHAAQSSRAQVKRRSASPRPR